MQLGEVPSTNSGRAERQSAPVLLPVAAAVSAFAARFEGHPSTEWMETDAPTSTGGFSCGGSTHMTAPAWSATARINDATTVHLLGDLYTVADDTTRCRCGRFAAGGRDIRTTRAFRGTSELFNVVVCILVSRREG
jgi:hypothetical protein